MLQAPKLADLEKKGEEKPLEKSPLFGLPKLKPVPKKEDVDSAKGDKSGEDKQTTPPKPDTDKRSSDSGKEEKKGSDLLKKPSLKDSDKPAVSPRPGKTVQSVRQGLLSWFKARQYRSMFKT